MPPSLPPSLPTVLRWPLWVAELATGAKSFVDNPILGSRRLHATGLHHYCLPCVARRRAALRRRMREWMAWSIRFPMSEIVPRRPTDP